MPTKAVRAPPREEARNTAEAIAGIGATESALVTALLLETATRSSKGRASAAKIASPFQYPSGKLSRFATLGSDAFSPWSEKVPGKNRLMRATTVTAEIAIASALHQYEAGRCRAASVVSTKTPRNRDTRLNSLNAFSALGAQNTEMNVQAQSAAMTPPRATEARVEPSRLSARNATPTITTHQTAMARTFRLGSE